MTQLKKSKTKKQMKKSIGNLYDALQREKNHHKKASDHCARMKANLIIQSEVIGSMVEEINTMNNQLSDAGYEKEIAANTMADLVSRLR